MLNAFCNAAHRAARRNTLLSGTALFGAALFGLADPTPASADQQFLKHGSLVISSSTYDPTQGPVAALKAGSTLPNTATATTKAVSGNNYVTIWNNASVDASFGVTSVIQLTDINLSNGKVFRSMQVPTDQVVTSFSSKSELGLHVLNNWPTVAVTFVGYAGAAPANGLNPPAVGVGLIDVSNSDAVPGQDPTNPVTFAFGKSYAFRRTIVSVDEKANIAYTPTNDYGGNNGRSALIGSNGLYYAVGNANNGNAATFGSSNGTNPDVTETTGLEVVTPLNASVVNATISSATSAEVDPLLQFPLNKNNTLDKPGKDTNYRGITEFGGALYFTKGSGSNGMDTVYTVQAPNSLPTLANAASSTIGVVPGFPTDSARATNGNFTPFAVFFANPTTMYVSDEGTGGSADTGNPSQPGHAGLEKWTLGSDGKTWQLQYVLTKGLIGVVDANVTGPAGPWPAITTIGLRNMTGRINGDGTVTLWATTSTSSASGDNGADPNKVVEITDQIAATQLSQVGNESFTTVMGPVYGTVFRGVGFVE
jgi:hypothetical protein